MTDTILDNLEELYPEYTRYFEGLQEGKLYLQKCGNCGKCTIPIHRICSACGHHELDWYQASGSGVIYSHAKLHRAYHKRHDPLPITLAWVDLEEGVRLATNILATESDQIKVGSKVELRFEWLEDGTVLPVFEVTQ